MLILSVLFWNGMRLMSGLSVMCLSILVIVLVLVMRMDLVIVVKVILVGEMFSRCSVDSCLFWCWVDRCVVVLFNDINGMMSSMSVMVVSVW